MHKIFGYNTHISEEIESMLAEIGAATIEDLFSAIPKNIRLKSLLNLPKPASEWEVEKHIYSLANKNDTSKTHLNFIGGGSYEHNIPAVIDAIVSRGEFLTSYTPYQPEMSQGLLQALYEYQTSVSAITGLPVVNSSCYDGATALADAAWVTCLAAPNKNKKSILVSDAIWPHHREVLATYMYGRDIEIHTLKTNEKTGKVDLDTLQQKLEHINPTGFLFQSPNAFGIIEDIKEIARQCKTKNVISVLSFNPLTSGLLTPPGKLGIDITICDGQVLGLPLNAGGSGLGIFATKKEYRKYVPGRLIGKVTDINGNLAYSLVYEDREQHVAREKATSNICSNQALNAIRSVIYLTLLGKKGLSRLAELNVRKARYLCQKLTKIPHVSLAYPGTFFNEFLLKLPKPVSEVQKFFYEEGIFAGLDLSGEYKNRGHLLLVAVTEVKSMKELDRMAEIMEVCLRQI